MMRRSILISVLIIICMSIGVFADSDINIKINGETVHYNYTLVRKVLPEILYLQYFNNMSRGRFVLCHGDVSFDMSLEYLRLR